MTNAAENVEMIAESARKKKDKASGEGGYIDEGRYRPASHLLYSADHGFQTWMKFQTCTIKF